MCLCWKGGLGRALGVNGGWLPLPTRPQRYCDPASLVFVQALFLAITFPSPSVHLSVCLSLPFFLSVSLSVSPPFFFCLFLFLSFFLSLSLALLFSSSLSLSPPVMIVKTVDGCVSLREFVSSSSSHNVFLHLLQY